MSSRVHDARGRCACSAPSPIPPRFAEFSRTCVYVRTRSRGRRRATPRGNRRTSGSTRRSCARHRRGTQGPSRSPRPTCAPRKASGEHRRARPTPEGRPDLLRDRLDTGEGSRISFYGTECQDKSLPFAYCPLQRRRPLPVGTCGVACPRSAGKHRMACPLPVRPRVRGWHRSRC
jgi:hypothetical protein